MLRGWIILVVVSLIGPGVAVGVEPVAYISQVEGDVQIRGGQQQTRKAMTYGCVYDKDAVILGTKAKLSLRFCGDGHREQVAVDGEWTASATGLSPQRNVELLPTPTKQLEQRQDWMAKLPRQGVVSGRLGGVTVARSGTPKGVLVSPIDKEVVFITEPTLTWPAAAGTTQYQVFVNDGRQQVWTTTTAATTASVPKGKLRNGSSYEWRVFVASGKEPIASAFFTVAFDSQRESAQALEELSKENAEALAFAAIACESNRFYTLAIKLYDELVCRSPKNPVFHAALADLYAKAGRDAESQNARKAAEMLGFEFAPSARRRSNSCGYPRRPSVVPGGRGTSWGLAAVVLVLTAPWWLPVPSMHELSSPDVIRADDDPAPPDPDLAALQESLRPLVTQIQEAVSNQQPLVAAGLQTRLVEQLQHHLPADHDFVRQAVSDLEFFVGEALQGTVAAREFDTARRGILLLQHANPYPDPDDPRGIRWADLFLLRWCLNQDLLDAAGQLQDRVRSRFAAVAPPDDPQRLEFTLLEGQYHERLTKYIEALARYRSVNDALAGAPSEHQEWRALHQQLRLEALAGLTQVATMSGEWSRATELCGEWRRLAEAQGAGLEDSVAESWLSQAAILRNQGRLADAEIACRKAIRYHPSSPVETAVAPLTSALAWNELALIQAALGEPARALESGLNARRIYESFLGAEAPVVARLDGNLAEIARRLPLESRQRFDGFLKQALQRASSTAQAPPRVLATLHQTAGLYSEINEDWPAARAEFAEAVQLRHAAMGDRHHATARARAHLAHSLLALGQLDEAENELQLAMTAFTEQLGPSHIDTAMAASDRALLSEIREQPVDAIERYRDALQRLTQGRARVGVRGIEGVGFGEHAHISIRLASLLAHTDRCDEAAAVWQAALGRSLRDELAVRELRALAPADFDSLRQLEDEHASLAANLARLTAADQRRADAAVALREKLSGVEASLGERRRELLVTQTAIRIESYDLPRIQAQLPDDGAIVGWLSREEAIPSPVAAHWGIVLRRRGPAAWIALPAEFDPLLAADVHSGIEREDFTPLRDLNGQLAELRRTAWDPLLPALAATEQLPAVARLIVMPSPGLQGVPIEVLAGSDLRVTYAPSGTIYAWLQERRANSSTPPGGGLLAIGDPQFENPRLPPGDPNRLRWPALPGTRQEVAAIAAVGRRQGLPVDQWLGSAANQPALAGLAERDALARYRYIHLATHGEANPYLPLRSRLILAQDELPDPVAALERGEAALTGELTAEAILRTWRLKADLVTLSACESALGRFTASEGYVGFAQALLLAGSQSLVCSLWKVDDLATALLMTRFYENLLGARSGLNAPLAKDEALHEAQRWLRQLSADDLQAMLAEVDRGGTLRSGAATTANTQRGRPPYEHPHYWAAFVLIGDPGSGR